MQELIDCITRFISESTQTRLRQVDNLTFEAAIKICVMQKRTCKKDQKEKQFIGLKHEIKITNREEVMVTDSAKEDKV
jgi:hypothetical protein